MRNSSCRARWQRPKISGIFALGVGSLTTESFIQRAVESGDPAIAEESLRHLDVQIDSASEAKQKAELLLGKAVLCGVLGRFSDARKQLDLVLEYAPDDLNIRLQRDFICGSLYDEERNPGEAFVRLTSVLSSHSERLSRPEMRFMYEDIQLRRGFDATSIGKFEDALSILKECLSFDLKPRDKSTVLSDLGRCYSEIKEYESARDCFLRAIEIGLTKQSEGDVHLHLAIACAHIGLYHDAKREFQLCGEKAGEYGFEIRKIYGWLSWVCGCLGEKAESTRYASLANPI